MNRPYGTISFNRTTCRLIDDEQMEDELANFTYRPIGTLSFNRTTCRLIDDEQMEDEPATLHNVPSGRLPGSK